MQTWSCSLCGIFNLQVPDGPVRCPHTPGANSGQSIEPSPLLLQQRRAWRDLHRYPLTRDRWRPAKARAWFDRWLERVQRFSCSCGDNLADYLTRKPIPFDSPLAMYDWSVDLHNWVNARLNKRQMTDDAAAANDVTRWQPHQQRPIDLVAVTSISPNPVHASVQMSAMRSWKMAGLYVLAVNDYADRHLLQPYEAIVDFWSWGDASRPLIYSLAKCSQQPMLIINSDIHIHGDNSRLQSILDSKDVGVGIRWNYHGSSNWRRSRREEWGLDAFLVRPEHVRDLPPLPFRIGLPLWDYWLPVHFESRGFRMQFIGDPYFFHRSHPIQWQPDTVGEGHRLLVQHYGPKIGGLADMRRRWPFPPKG